MNVKYCGPALDYSGYGEASRHHLAALHAAGVHVLAQLPSYSTDQSDFGNLGALAIELANNTGDYKVKIIHTTPDQYGKFMEPGKYHIGAFYWETDTVPLEFVNGLNKMDEIWTASQANKDAIIKSGCAKPVYIFPQATETERAWPEPYRLRDFEGFLFYSIFEWTDRKNPMALINAYFQEFQNDENVGLLIKTYFRNFTLQHKRMIKASIAKAKAKSGLEKFPPIFLYLDLMDRTHIMRLHKTGNCYVSAHRGEGWGIPQVEAALAGNLVITTGYGGVNEYFAESGTAVVLPYEMVNLDGMLHSTKWYSPDQKWAEVDLSELRRAMRFAYNQQDEAANLARSGQEFVQREFALDRVGKLMAARIEEVEAKL